MRKFVILGTFFVASPVLLLFAIVLFLFVSLNRTSNHLAQVRIPKTVAFAALPSVENILTQEISQQDARVEMVRQFFHRYGSPLEPYASNVVTVADTYNLDFRLLPAIAMQESNLCLKAPALSNNCWGFGIYGGHVKTFPSYDQAIETVAKALAKDYKSKGLIEPEQIVNRWTPSDTGLWVTSVTYFMNELQ